MLVTEDTIPWLAGIVEADGYLGAPKCAAKQNGKVYEYFMPRISVAMTDRDIVERVANMFGVTPRTKEHRPPRLPVHIATIAGKPALVLMLKLFPYLGTRRRARLAESLSLWEHN